MNKYVLSDIHGCLKTFRTLLKKISFSEKDELYIIGDLIDRGPESKGVFDFIWKLQDEQYQIFCSRGNHEQMMLDSIDNSERQGDWLKSGGWKTIEDFGVDKLSEIPKEYFHFLEKLPYYFEVDNYILVHAGLSFKSLNPFQELDSLLWKRNWYKKIDYDWLNSRIIVHGHAPISKKESISMLHKLKKNRYLNIDTGCVYKGYSKSLGTLTCFNLGSQELIFQENIDIDVSFVRSRISYLK